MTNMSFGPYSESEIKQITTILDHHNVHYEVQVDKASEVEIKQSMKNNFRHYYGSSIKAHILSILIAPDKLDALNEQTQSKLNDLGLYWKEMEFDEVFGEEYKNQVELEERRPKASSPWKSLRSILLIIITMAYIYILLRKRL